MRPKADTPSPKTRSAAGGIRAAVSLPWLPATVFVLLCGLVAALYWAMDHREQDELRGRVAAEAEHMTEVLVADVQNRTSSIERMVKRWELEGGTPEREFAADARAYIADNPGYQAIEWVDRDYRVRWVIPLEGNEQALGLDLAKETKRRAALEKARDLGSPSATASVDLVQGGKGVLMYFPISVRGEFDGMLLAVYRFDTWFGEVLGGEAGEDFIVEASYDGIPVYASGGRDELAAVHASRFASATMARAEAKVIDHRVSFELHSTPRYAAASRSALPAATAAAGLVLAILASVVVHLLQKSRLEGARANEARIALGHEIEEHSGLEERLEHALSRLDMATKAGGIGVWSWDLVSGRLEWNERMFALLAIPPDVSPTYATWRDSLHPDDLPAAEDLLRKAVEGKAVFNTEFRVLLPNGRVRYLGAAARVARDPGGKALQVTGINWDLTASKEAEEALRLSEARVRLLLESTAEAIYGINLDGNCTFANPACVRMLGYSSPGQLLGRNMHWLIHHSWPDGRRMEQEDCHIFHAFRAGEGVHVDDEVLWKADGTSFPVEYWSFPQIQDGMIMGAVVTFMDISERLAAQEKIRHLATHDSLTDLPRMPLARDRLSMAVSAAKRRRTMGAAMFVDLDGFKAVNDSLGHDAGDAVLREVAKRLGGCVRASDTVARIGGDEFLVIVPDLSDPEDAARIAGHIEDAVSVPVVHEGREARIGASIGIVLFPGAGEDVDQLVKLADEAMYEIKKHGKGGYGFAPGPGSA